MLFNSYIFVFLFLPLTVCLYFLFHSLKCKKLAGLTLFGMSLWFYGYFNPSYVLVICGSILMNYCISILLLKKRLREKKQLSRLVMALGVALNLGILFYFKYFDFFLENMNALFSKDFTLRNIVLPLGISFFTFQQISYVVDSYRGQTEGYSLLDYAVFVAFFPQLVAGPIVLHKEMIPQFQAKENHTPQSYNLCRGLHIFAVGLVKKIILADTLGNMVTLGFGGVEILSSVDVLLVMVSYTLQLYFDFSGYSDMATGIASLFNIHIPMNFNSPYKALSITEFWDRWHITLTRFFREYVYFPLGGSRKGRARAYGNVMIIFLLSGFWHGANWTFVLWGILHGAGDVLTRIFHKSWNRLHAAFRWFVTFGFISATFLIFRADSISQAFIMFRKVLTVESLTITPTLFEGLTLPEIVHLEELLHLDGMLSRINGFHMWAFLAVAMFIVLNTRNCYEKEFKPKVSNAFATVGMLTWCVLSMSGISTFLYFNF